MTIEQDIANLQKQISELKQKETLFTTSITTNPFSTLGERKIEQGSTGSARYRRLDIPRRTLKYTISERGNFSSPTAYVESVNSNPQPIKFGWVPIPSDAISGGFPTINMLWSSTEATNTVGWKWDLVGEVKEGDNDERTLLAEAGFTNFAAPATTNTMSIISTALTIPPTPGSFISVLCSRDGSDTNSGILCTWCIWLEYLAHS